MDAPLGGTRVPVLSYAQQRWYDPRTGRFLSEDPVFGDLARPSSLHAFGYASGNPVVRVDPEGTADGFLDSLFGNFNAAMNPALPPAYRQMHAEAAKMEAQVADYGSKAVIATGAVAVTGYVAAPLLAAGGGAAAVVGGAEASAGGEVAGGLSLLGRIGPGARAVWTVTAALATRYGNQAASALQRGWQGLQTWVAGQGGGGQVLERTVNLAQTGEAAVGCAQNPNLESCGWAVVGALTHQQLRPGTGSPGRGAAPETDGVKALPRVAVAPAQAVDVAERIEVLADLKRARQFMGPLPAGQGAKLQPDSGTLASLRIDQQGPVYGANATAERALFGTPTRFAGSAARLFEGPPVHPTRLHAEGAAFERARQLGIRGRRGVLAVDNELCSFCEWGVDELARSLGLSELEVVIPGRAPETRKIGE